MGLVIMISSLITYILGTRYVADPDLVSLIVMVITIILLVITFSMTRSLEGLAEANKLKSEFISIVSHQLRSPISNAKWAAEVLISKRFGNLDDKQVEYIKIFQENNDRMAELVSDLLMVSRIEEGKLIFQPIEFDLKELTEKIIIEFRPLAEASNVKIDLEFSSQPLKVWADPVRIKIVLENFLDNAIRYIRESGTVKIKIKNLGSRLLFEIKDTGVGIPKQDQQHIFQRFFRSENVLKDQTHGSGLGLSIAKSIIEKSKGKIWFKSQEGIGSTFWFTLPIKQT